MKRFGRLLLYIAAFLAALMLFAPKANLYYLLEEQLRPLGVVIGGETLRDTGFGLEIDGGTLYAKQIESASAERVSVGLFGAYNRVTVKNLQLAKAFEKFWPARIERADAVLALWDPLHLTIDAEGDFGTLRAVIALDERSVDARIVPSQLMLKRYGATLRQMQKDDTGGYRYESRF